MKNGLNRRGVLAGIGGGGGMLAAGFAGAQQLSLTGQYQSDGRNPDGSPYAGVVRIEDNSGVVAMTWDVGGQTTTGTGRVEGRVLTVDWGSEAPVIYVIMEDGSLHGTWARGKALELLTLIP